MGVAPISSQYRYDLSIVVVNYNTCHLLERLFSSIKDATLGLSIQTIVVDNASIDGSIAILRSLAPSIETIFNDRNIGFGRANNQAVELARGRHVLLLNTDAFVSPDTLTKTLAWMDNHPDCGVLGVRLTDETGFLQASCRFSPTIFNVFLSRTGLSRWFPWVDLIDDMNWDHSSVRECDWVPGCFYLIRGETLRTVGLFDSRFFMYYEEVDHCKRVLQAGWKVFFYPYTRVIHIGGESAKSVAKISRSGRQISEIQIESELLYFKKHNGWVGLLGHLQLVTLGDLYLMLRDTLKGRGGKAIGVHFKHLTLTFRKLFATGMANRPTR